jgi:FkbM family methyltransferase
MPLLRRRRRLPPAVAVPTEVGELLAHPHDRVITPELQRHGTVLDTDIGQLTQLDLEGATVLDVGAHIGLTSLLLSRTVGPRGRVVAVEPHPANAALLRENLRRTRTRNVEVVEAAALEAPGTAVLSEADDNTGDHRVGALLDERPVLEVRAVALDDLLPAEHVPYVHLDTQATEHRALAGAARLIERSRPLVHAEFWPAGIEVAGGDPAQVLAGYRAAGFVPSVLEHAELGPEPADEAILEAIRGRPGSHGGFATLVLTPA